MHGVRRPPTLAAIALAAFASPVAAAPPLALETHVLLKVDVLIVDDGRSATAGTSGEAEIGPDGAGTVDLNVKWPPDRTPLAVRLVAKLDSISPDGDAVLSLKATVERDGRSPVVASRQMQLADEGSGLFEVYGDGGKRLLLTLHGEKVKRAVLHRVAEVGEPVTLTVAVLRVDGDRVVLLETNELHTFVGQSVEYSFHRGAGDGLESVRLELTPSTVSGEVVTLDTEIDGTLPSPSGAVILSHQERIVASRQATSSLTATAGAPPAGYRFQVTPDF